MITFNQTPGNDNELIFMLRVRLDSGVIYATTYQGGLTLSGNNYENVLQYGSITPLQASANAISGGCIEAIQTMTFQLIRWGGYYIGDFYPTSSADYLSGREVDFGICWNSVSDESEVTWIYTGYIHSFSVLNYGVEIETFERNELAMIQLPYYSIQNNANNGVSYFTDAPQESYGLSIPILYGDFTTVNFQYSDVHLAPAITVNKNKHEVIVCSHKINTSVYNNYNIPSSSNIYYLFKHVQGNNCYIVIYSDSTNETNNTGYYTISIRDAGIGIVLGYSIIQLKALSGFSDISDVEGATDQDSSTYSTLTATSTADNRLALRCIDTIGSSSFGNPNYASSGVAINMLISTQALENFDIGYANYNLTTPSAKVLAAGLTLNSSTPTLYTYLFGNLTDAKRVNSLPWSIDEVTELEFYIENNGTSAGGNQIRVYNMYLELKEIYVNAPKSARRIVIPRKKKKYISGTGETREEEE